MASQKTVISEINENTFFTGKLSKSISGKNLMHFIFVNIFFDHIFFWLFLISFIVTAVFGVVSAVFISSTQYWQAKVLTVFNYYFLIFFTLLYFIIIFRLSSHFLDRRIDDKSIYIIVSNQVSRRKFMFYVFVLSSLILLATLVLNVAIYLSVSSVFYAHINMFLIRITLSLLLYTSVFSICLFVFFQFLLSVFSKNLVMIISSFVIALNFISSLPDQFGEKSMENKYITITYRGEQKVETVPEWTNIINFKNAVDKEQMLYPHLSQALYKFLYDNDWRDNSSFAEIGDERISFYKDLGLIESESVRLNLTGVVLSGVPTSWASDTNLYSVGRKVDIYFNFTNRFISMDELAKKIETESGDTKLVLQDMYNFTNDLLKDYKNDAVAMAVEKQNTNVMNIDEYNLFDTASQYSITANDGNSTSVFATGNWIQNYSTDGDYDNRQLRPDDAKTVIKSVLTGTNAVRLTINTNQGQVTKELNNFIANPLQVAATMIDNDFIYMTSRYHVVESGKVSMNNDYNSYLAVANRYKLLHYVNVFAANVSNFTAWTEQSYKQYWFYTNAKQSINLQPFKNAILSSDWFKLIVDENGALGNNVAKNTIPPWYFMAGTGGVLVVLLIAIIAIFNRRDL